VDARLHGAGHPPVGIFLGRRAPRQTPRRRAKPYRLLAAATVLVCVSAVPVAALASNRILNVGAGSSAEAQATGAPAIPSNVAAACVSLASNTIKVTWNAVAGASSYVISQSTTSSTSGYSVVASGITATSWTSGALSGNNYWYEVASAVGTHWLSSPSAASGESTILLITCTQP
jgi:hypothetical protein